MADPLAKKPIPSTRAKAKRTQSEAEATVLELIDQLEATAHEPCCGSAAHSRTHALAMLQSALPAAVKKLVMIATTDERKLPGEHQCALCGCGLVERRSEALQVQAITTLMDRGGLGPKATLEITDPDAWVEHLTRDEALQLKSLMDAATARMSKEPIETTALDITDSGAVN